ncbi:hypothetical protein A3196_06285 [Candidatus Thiodiazotropha endoloripes]|uniref:Uncharacterized protein n=1 Tax=Candidatus Thiodiazotropha endoloripes TaxID=1818881 RepID=A0A1E2UNR8_9GAMM|nr:hypothetical protein A3196_06285 [Candidatus Thiodiazotropha endoloripes]
MRNRHLVPRDGQVIDRYRNGWVLYLSTDHSGAGWVNLKLVDTRSEKRTNYKRTYRLGWDGERFARNVELSKLIDRMPVLYDAINELLLKMTACGDLVNYGVYRPTTKRYRRRGRGVRISRTWIIQNRLSPIFYASTNQNFEKSISKQ